MTCDMCGCTLFVDMWVCHSPTKSHTGGSAFTLGDTGHSSRSEGVNIGAGENRVYKSSALGVWTVGLIRSDLYRTRRNGMIGHAEPGRVGVFINLSPGDGWPLCARGVAQSAILSALVTRTDGHSAPAAWPRAAD